MEFLIKINNDNLVAHKNKRSDHPRYLNELISSLSACIENYQKLARESDSPELKVLANKLAIERSEFMLLLKDNFNNKRKNHNALSKIKPFWVKLIKGLAHSKDDQAMIEIISKSEIILLKKYERYLYHHIPTVEQLDVLVEQKRAVNEAVDLFKAGNSSHVHSIDSLVPTTA